MSDKIYTLPFDFVVEILLESQQQYDVAKCLVKDMLLDNSEENNSYVFSLYCELIWSNLTLISLVGQEVDEISTTGEKDDHMVVSEQVILSLQGIVLTRHHALNELNKLSISTSVH